MVRYLLLTLALFIVSTADISMAHDGDFVAEKKADGTWSVVIENDIPPDDHEFEHIFGTKQNPGELRKVGKVTTLAIIEARISSKSLALVVEALPDIEELVLSGTDVDEDGVKEIAKLRKLKFLMPGKYLSRAIIDLQAKDKPVPDELTSDYAIKHLVGHPSLEALDLQTCRVTDAGLDYLLGLKLKRLDLSHQRITAAGLQKLKAIPTLEELHLRALWLPNTTIDEVVVGLSGLKNLRVLTLDFNTDFTGVGLEKVTGLDSLENFRAYQVRFEGANVAHLARFPKLQQVWLHGIKQQNGVDDFLALKGLQGLKKVIVGRSKENESAKANFAKALPKTELLFYGE